MKKAIWDAMLDADMHARYWSSLARRYTQRDTCLKIFLAVMSSSAVAGWGLWASNPPLWKALSAISAVIAVALPIINLQKLIQRMNEVTGKWLHILADYENLWIERRNCQDDVLLKRYKEIKSRETAVKENEHSLPVDNKLLNESQDSVLVSRGI